MDKGQEQRRQIRTQIAIDICNCRPYLFGIVLNHDLKRYSEESDEGKTAYCVLEALMELEPTIVSILAIYQVKPTIYDIDPSFSTEES